MIRFESSDAPISRAAPSAVKIVSPAMAPPPSEDAPPESFTLEFASSQTDPDGASKTRRGRPKKSRASEG
jgi:hypothetical protein